MDTDLESFREFRSRMNDKILAGDNLGIKRFLNLDTAAYRDGALPGRTKELLGLVSSMVLRCNDCIDYHLERAVQAGWREEEIVEAMQVALIVGGSIVIPHLRHAFATLEALRLESAEQGAKQGQK